MEGGREQPAGFMLCWKGVWWGAELGCWGRLVLPEEKEAPGGEGAVGERRLY